MALNNVTKYTKNAKPVNAVDGASPAMGKIKKTSIYAGSPNELPAYGGDMVNSMANKKGGSKDMKKPKGY